MSDTEHFKTGLEIKQEQDLVEQQLNSEIEAIKMNKNRGAVLAQPETPSLHKEL